MRAYDVTVLAWATACVPGALPMPMTRHICGTGNPRRTDEDRLGKGCQVMIEGPGHVPMHKIKVNMDKQLEGMRRGAVLYAWPAHHGYRAGL